MGLDRPLEKRFLGTLALSIAALLGFLYVFDARAMATELQGVAPVPLLAGFLAVLLAMACWAESMRRILLASGGHVQPFRGFLAYATGMFAKQVLPMGNAGGLPIMAYAIDREADIGFNRSLAVVTIGDFIGLCSTLGLTVAGVAYVVVQFPGTRLLEAALVGVAILAAALTSIGVLLLYRRSVLRYLVLGVARLLRGTLGRYSGRIETRFAPETVGASVDRYFETVDAVRSDSRSVLVAVGLAVVGWTAFAVPLYTSARAVGYPIAFGLVLFVVSVGGVATLVPMPGGLGGVEFAIGGLLVATMGIDLAVAGATVLVYRLAVYWFPILIGIGALLVTGTSVRSLNASVEDVPGRDDRDGI
ncbi:lysylphosphatidylglycerol synthase transmembrane domain-containing protein [Halorhabdus amylolytica]|uniref:lysylphosphatidylglycerol synthase transmembrane domain-containing protein n=1 Tax=Halorhabdus amylolytica TaxID=2559573 RepID=UPI0010AB4E0E|nr:lysylphosphatidylglycerol synthase transmembrane domain-containing protein [Halorhabdus amylolytica]